jgi:hypothetical protein
MNQQHIYSELLEKLTSIDNDMAWYEFMSMIDEHIPALFTGRSGGLTEEQKKGTIIETGGFASWTAMRQATPEEGGFGMPTKTWESYKKAYAATKKHPYLVGLGLTANKINGMLRQYAEDFPLDLESMRELKTKEYDQKEIQKQASVQALKDKIAELESQLLVSNVKNEELQNQNIRTDLLMLEFKSAFEESADLKLQNKQLLEKKNEAVAAHNSLFTKNEELKSEYAKLKNLGFGGRLKRLFSNK